MKVPHSIKAIILVSFFVFGGIYAYSIGMFQPKHSEDLVMPARQSSSSVAAIVKPENLPLDKRSKTYINKRFGYSVAYPTYLLNVANCDYVPYPSNGYPVTVVEDGDSAFITPEFYAYAKYEDANSSDYTCTNVQVTLDTIRILDMPDKLWYYHGWHMVGEKDISNDAKLLAFIRKWYGSSCDIASKNPTDQPGVYDVEIKGDTGDDTAESSKCPLNFIYALKYAPSKQTAVTWKIGQDGRFDDLDGDMVQSFRFE